MWITDLRTKSSDFKKKSARAPNKKGARTQKGGGRGGGGGKRWWKPLSCPLVDVGEAKVRKRIECRAKKKKAQRPQGGTENKGRKDRQVVGPGEGTTTGVPRAPVIQKETKVREFPQTWGKTWGA